MTVSPIESVVVSGVISSKKIDEEVPMEKRPEEKADIVVSPEQPVSVSETITEDTVESVVHEKVTEQFGKVVHSKKKATVVTEVETQPSVEKLKKKKPKPEKATSSVEDRAKDQYKVTKPVVLTKEIDDVLKDIRVEEFGPGEQPVKELATVGILLRKGVSVTEVTFP